MRGFKFFLAAAYLWMIGVNTAANVLPINGVTTAAVSDAYSNLFTPAGITFSIWGVIYLLLGIFVFHVIFSWRRETVEIKRLVVQIGPIFIANAILNGLWILAWHHQQIGLSLLIMAGLLVSLILIERATWQVRRYESAPWYIWVPFSVYLGWICVATIANATVYLVSIGWTGFGLPETFWMVLIVAVGSVIGYATMQRFCDGFYGGVFLWAYAGILMRQVSETGLNGQYPYVVGAVIIAWLFLAFGLIRVVRRPCR